MSYTSESRAEVRVGTLVVFVTMVLVASIAAGVLINTVGLGAGTGGPAEGATADRILVISQTGQLASDGHVGVVNLTVTAAPGAEDIDLRDATVTWVGPDGVYNVASSAAGESADGTFAVAARRDPSGAAPVLDEPADRLVLTFDVGGGEVDGAAAFGSDLGPGDMVGLTVTTGDGLSTATRLAVPRSPTGDGPVVL